jgi:four helix bundle protein
MNDFADFLSIAKGSLMETETCLMLVARLNYLNLEQANPTTLCQINEITKMLTSLSHRILNTP